MSAQPKTPYFQWLRLFAAAAVVLMHTAADGFNYGTVDSAPWAWFTLWDSAVRWPVPIFMMITGALFLPRKTTLRQVLTVYIPRMAVCWLIWSAVYALHSGGDFFAKLAAGHYHLWYLPYLCGIYLAMPFLQRIVSDEKLAKGLLAVSVVIGLVIPWLAELLIFLLPGWSGILRSLKGHLEFTFFMDCLALVLLGDHLHRQELTPKQRRCIYIGGLLGIVATAVATLWLSRQIGTPCILFFDFKAPTNLCAAIAVFVFAKYNLSKLPKFVDSLARWSFGIYLLHPLAIEVLAKTGICVPAPWTPVLAAAVFAICALIAAVLTKIPRFGKYLA